ncbi:MAG: hypothetical protein ACYTAN_15160 [Planctomycetota bacterium]|jgi:hypothetical protein
MSELANFKRPRAITIAGLTALLLTPALARAVDRWDLLSTSFSDNATHIVVVTEGSKIDGEVKVLESWKGYLQRGQEITVEELADFSSADSRKVSPRAAPPANLTFKQELNKAYRRSLSWAQGHGPLVYADHVTCKRMILFLMKQEDDGVVNWVPAAFDNQIKTSVAWVEYGYVYGFLQFRNPGPLMLGMYRSEEAFKQMVIANMERRAYERDSVAAAEKAVEAAAGMASAQNRVEAIAPFFRWDVRQARKIALDAAKPDAGTALPLLVEVFNDESLNIMIRTDAMEALGAAGPAAGPFLTAVVVREFEFWKKTAPTLQEGWWNGKGLAREDLRTLRDRYGIILSALKALAEMDYPECVRIVTEFRDFWRSLPQLEDESGLDQMSETADLVIERQAGVQDPQ